MSLKIADEKMSFEKSEILHKQRHTIKFYVKFKKMATEMENIRCSLNESAIHGLAFIADARNLKVAGRVRN